ncbi:MAG: hypothetical protein KDI10_14210 [Halioglobus sp.]|nr:hypothetical protein [Halioglobus sp.]MCB1709868.1 hypothetical protein [Halioglobus sp.]MCP5122921.1 hypothetical protein [Pseudomonadales bacterium]MCP5193832.1 hypothetical protein [Pseudomonadales bacterium]
MLNRSTVMLKPRQPFLDWAARLDDSGLVPSRDDERTIYLIPEYDDIVEAMEILARCYDIIFEMELEGWHLDETAWPEDRTFRKFRDWFEIEFHSVVADLCDFPMIDDDDEISGTAQ